MLKEDRILTVVLGFNSTIMNIHISHEFDQLSRELDKTLEAAAVQKKLAADFQEHILGEREITRVEDGVTKYRKKKLFTWVAALKVADLELIRTLLPALVEQGIDIAIDSFGRADVTDAYMSNIVKVTPLMSKLIAPR